VSVLEIRTCAKINLCLRVLGRRNDGYHNVETVLHTVGLWDRVRLTELPPGEGIALAASAVDAPQDEANLCWRAARLLAEKTRCGRGVAIDLEKGIPVGAGLGGGSSDAAATLAGLSRLWQLDLSEEELAAAGAEIGADVSFFLRGGCCLARERGEKLEPLPAVSAWLVLVTPERQVSTGQAYAALGRGAARGRRGGPTREIARTMDALESGDLTGLARTLHNDFEKARMAAISDSLAAKAALVRAGCLGASLTGSGSGVFGIASDHRAAERAAELLRPRWPWVAVAETVPASEHLMVEEMAGE
jgi:4-diphosphocytidyl-2-C-methyl-D-erythritol kinase